MKKEYSRNWRIEFSLERNALSLIGRFFLKLRFSASFRRNGRLRWFRGKNKVKIDIRLEIRFSKMSNFENVEIVIPVFF